MRELYEKIFWLNVLRNAGSTFSGMMAQSKTERWLNLAGLSAQKHPDYSVRIASEKASNFNASSDFSLPSFWFSANYTTNSQ